MTNTYKFMILTGKYLPEENIKFDGELFYFERLDDNNNCLYYEDSRGEWETKVFDKNKCLRFDDSDGYWFKKEYHNKFMLFEDSEGYWYKKNLNGNVIESGKL